MRRLVAAMLSTLMPLAAAGQSLGGYPGRPVAEELLMQPQAPASGDGLAAFPGTTTPLWRGSDGRMLALRSGDETAAEANRSDAPLGFRVVDASKVVSSGLQYDLGPHLQAQFGVNERSWANGTARVVGSEIGAAYIGDRYSLGLSLGANSVPNSTSLPRLLPGTAPGLAGSLPLSGFDSSTQVNARGRLALDNKSSIALGASVGRIRLLPGNLLGISSVDQKALSFGVDRGPISGTVVGRVMQPEAGIPGGFSGERRWSSIDLGVTWRLPWQGELSFGAQNVWTSGPPANTPAGPEPDQARTPYVQYHQDL